MFHLEVYNFNSQYFDAVEGYLQQKSLFLTAFLKSSWSEVCPVVSQGLLDVRLFIRQVFDLCSIFRG